MTESTGRPWESREAFKPECAIDEVLARYWRQMGVRPAQMAADAVFLRRVSLDLTGRLPAAEETVAYLRSPGRKALIDRLLASDAHAGYMAMRWSDLLRVKAEFPVNLWPNAAQAYYHWIRQACAENWRYDRFVRELLMGSGSNFRSPASNFYRAMQSRTPEGAARSVALTFLGSRAERWPKARLDDLAGFFSKIAFKETGEWKEEIVYFDPAKAGAALRRFPDGTPAKVAAGEDPRAAFAAWLTGAGRGWMGRVMVNRLWAWMFGRGLVHQPDDLRPDNPPSHPELLALLERELVGSGFDLKHVLRLIANSAAYRLSAIPAGGVAPAPQWFACYPLRRLEAEVLIDALCSITGAGESYSSSIPEPYTFMPDDQRAVELPDGSISSPFLELFGRPPRDTGLDSERNNRVSAAQRLHLLNSTHIQRMLQQAPKLTALLKAERDPRRIVNEIYLAVLTRYPTDEEWSAVAEHNRASGAKGREAVVDLAWALLNTTEFQFRH